MPCPRILSDDARSDPPGGAPVDSGRKFTTRIVSICIGVLLFFSALLNVALYDQAYGGIQHASLGGRWSQPPPSKFALDKPSEDGACGKGLAHMCVERRSGADDPFARLRSPRPDVCWCGRPATVFTLDRPSKDGVCGKGLVDMCVDQSSVPRGAPNSYHLRGEENADVGRPPHHHSDPMEEQQKMCELVCGGRDPSLRPPNQPPSPDDPSLPPHHYQPPSPDDWNENEEFELKVIDYDHAPSPLPPPNQPPSPADVLSEAAADHTACNHGYKCFGENEACYDCDNVGYETAKNGKAKRGFAFKDNEDVDGIRHAHLSCKRETSA